MNIVYHVDCMEYMKTLPDKFFDLAVVDPPYGGGSKGNEGSEIAGGGRTLREGNAPASAVGLTAIISAERDGRTWAKKYQHQRRAGCVRPI